MFPGFDGFHWTFGHILFLSIFFAVLLTLGTTVVIALRRTARDMSSGKAAAICWQADFAELPESERRCRHELAGRIECRTCPNAFDCRRCPDYARFAVIKPVADCTTFGLNYPTDRFYHRGHTWVRAESDGSFTIGLDDMADHLVGRPDFIELPTVGTEIAANGPGWRMEKSGRDIQVRAPLDGTVVETGDYEKGWYLKLRPKGNANLQHLLRGAEVNGWLGFELERLQLTLGQPEAGLSLADGGILMTGLMDGMPEADWDTALAATFLEA